LDGEVADPGMRLDLTLENVGRWSDQRPRASVDHGLKQGMGRRSSGRGLLPVQSYKGHSHPQSGNKIRAVRHGLSALLGSPENIKSLLPQGRIFSELLAGRSIKCQTPVTMSP
jgi:hypothetical protein